MPIEAADRRILPAGRDGFRWNLPERLNIAERCCDSWAAAEPERLAVIHVDGTGEARRITYGDLASASDGLATVLAARGVGAGDRVALLLGPGPEVLIGHFAAMKLGAVSLPLFTLFGPDALEYRLRDSGARVAITDTGNVGKLTGLAAGLPDLAAILCTGAAGPGAEPFWPLVEAADPLRAPHATAAEDPAMMIYTSGTTGSPKGVLHAHRFLLGHLPCFEVNHPDVPLPGDVGWTPADWAWIGGLMDLALPCLHYGIPLVAHRMRKFDADAAWQLVARFGVTRMFLPPTALRAMRRVDVPGNLSVRSIGSGGEALGADLLDWGRDVLRAPINELYGQTECNLVVASDASHGVQRQGFMGRAVPGHRVAVLGGDGREAAAGETGRIAVRRPDPAMFLGYWNQPEKTAAKFSGDWMLTGDLGRADADGYIAFVARDDDVITTSGYRVGPAEIEDCLCRHEDVEMAAVVGLPDADRTEIVTAFVVPAGTANPEGLAERLIRHVRAQLSPHLAPRAVHLRDSLPMTATGKIMRRALRDQTG